MSCVYVWVPRAVPMPCLLCLPCLPCLPCLLCLLWLPCLEKVGHPHVHAAFRAGVKLVRRERTCEPLASNTPARPPAPQTKLGKPLARRGPSGYMGRRSGIQQSYISFLYIPTVNFHTFSLIYALGRVCLFAPPWDRCSRCGNNPFLFCSEPGLQ